MKKITFILAVIISISLLSINPVNAEKVNSDQIYNNVLRYGKESLNSTATLISPDGKEYTFNVYESNEMQDTSMGNSIMETGNQKLYKDFAVEIQGIGNISEEEWDVSGGVKAWGRLYYDKDGRNILVTRMEGDWRNYDGYPTVLKDQQAFVYCVGQSPDGTIQQTQQILRDVYGDFDFNTRFTKYVDLDEMISSAGGLTKVTIERNSSTWKLNLDLSIY